jgi:BioD-like phosphotransacetylase family protein
MVVEGEKVDEDAVLFKQALGAAGEIKDLNPVTIPRGFTQEYIFNRDPDRIRREIETSFADVSAGRDLAVIEGTGHAGVGSVIDASNAAVAAMLGADCIIISGGGIGRCIDEICLNRALFEREGVRCLGAVINKVYEEKYEKIDRAVRQGLSNVGVDCLGVIPYKPELTYPTIAQIQEEQDLEVLSGKQFMANQARRILVGAMEPEHMVSYLKGGCLLVIPGDRIDDVLTAVDPEVFRQSGPGAPITGLLITGGLMPSEGFMETLAGLPIPVLLSGEDTATAAYAARKLVAKTGPDDADKIALAARLVAEYVDMDRILG